MTETLIIITVVCLIAWLLVRTVLRHHPSGRYFVCLAALVLVLLTPGLIDLRHFTSFGLVTVTLPQSVGASDNTPIVASPSSQNDWLLWSVSAIWTLGVIVGIQRLVSGWRQATQLKKRATPIAVAADIQASVERILKRPLPPVYASHLVTTPVAVGVFSPVVILPTGWAETLTPLALRHILLHEAAHIALGHTLGGAIERLAGIFLWPHPLVRLLCRELALAREEVCDNVASQEAGAACYARTLLVLAQGMSPAPNLASMLALQGPETSLEARITGLLNPRRNRMIRVSRGKLWAAGLAVCALVSTVAVRVVAAEPKTNNAPANKKQATSTVRVEKRDGKFVILSADGKTIGGIALKGGGPATEGKTFYSVELEKGSGEIQLRTKQKAKAVAKPKSDTSPTWVWVTKRSAESKGQWTLVAK